MPLPRLSLSPLSLSPLPLCGCGCQGTSRWSSRSWRKGSTTSATNTCRRYPFAPPWLARSLALSLPGSLPCPCRPLTLSLPLALSLTPPCAPASCPLTLPGGHGGGGQRPAARRAPPLPALVQRRERRCDHDPLNGAPASSPRRRIRGGQAPCAQPRSRKTSPPLSPVPRGAAAA